jgi:flagellar M-ring protein FliF
MATSDDLLGSARNYLKTTPKSKLYTYLFLLVAIVGGSIIGLSFIQKETYTTLFAGLSTEDASMVVMKLKELKVPYQLGLGGTAVYVPKEKVYDVRLMLAGQNSLPGGAGMGFELFDKTNYGMTEFMQNVNYKRAIQGELSRTINQMPEIKGSRVHIAIPEKTLYSDREKEVTSSVFLKIKPGKALSKDQVMGIVQLVAGSVEGLKPDNVTVVDSSGRVLYKNGGNGSNATIAISGQQYDLQKSVEKTLEESVQSMLDKFIPYNRSIVRASVELNLRKIEKVEEEVQPTKSVITAEKKSKERSVNKTGGPGGVPGVASNVPNVAGKSKADIRTDGGTGKTNESEREESQISYEVSKTVRKIVEPFGDIKRMSLAIVVDGKYEKVKGPKGGEELKYSPRSQKDLSDIKGIVSRAVGYDEERGDKIEVLNVPFEVEKLADEKGAFDSAERTETMYSMGKYAFYVVIFLAVFFLLVKPLLNILKSRVESTPLQQIKDVYVKSGGATGELFSVENKQQTALTDAMKDKALVGSIIKEWVREGT